MSQVTLKALSESLRLTEGTVSRALNDYPDISAKTRKRVKDAALRMGYRPNSNARRLAMGKAECVGYVLPWRSGHISEPIIAEVLDGLSKTLGAHQWDLLVANAQSAEDELAVIERLVHSNSVSGIVLSRTQEDDRRIALLQKLDFPFVAHGRTANCDEFAWFDVDSETAFCDATIHLAGLGHDRIALIRGPEQVYSFALRQQGYRKGLNQMGLPHDPALEPVSPDLTDKGGYEAMRLLLALAVPPTAVVCVSDMVAVGALKAIREAGKTPGVEISVIGYDGLPLGEHTNPPLSTMEQPAQDVGRTIGEMLLEVIKGDDPRNQQKLRQAVLNRRESDGPKI
jgi:LacI family transcriptional regulator